MMENANEANMKHATDAQGKRALRRWNKQKAQEKATAQEKFMQDRRNSFKLGARISPEVFNALSGTFSR
jgi:hypothetical protein